MVNNGHFVLRERAGLVRADDLGTAECFNSGKLPDNGVFLRHICNADGKNNRNNGGKSLRNRRNGK